MTIDSVLTYIRTLLGSSIIRCVKLVAKTLKRDFRFWLAEYQVPSTEIVCCCYIAATKWNIYYISMYFDLWQRKVPTLVAISIAGLVLAPQKRLVNPA